MALTPFVDALPIPRYLKPKKRYKKFTYYEVTMKETFVQMHSELPKPTRVWGYEGQVPGPIIEAERGEILRVKWINDLPEEHFLPVDKSLHGSGEHMPEVRTVVHLHGAEVEPESDGYPEAWFTREFEQTGPSFEREVYEYPNSQRATALWYHDHALGITRLNVYAGLAGMYIIRDDHERLLNLPSGLFEIPLIISDKGFNEEDGSLVYPRNLSDPPPPGFPDPSVTPGEAFDYILVNGKVWPFLTVQQRKYRFRILNASNERFYRMKLDSGQPFIQIGSDGGLLQRPVELDQITIGPSERLDVIIDFSDQPVGTNIVLTNDARTPFDFGAPVTESTARIMQFKVVPLQAPDTSEVPSFLSYIQRYQECDVTRIRDVTLDVSRDHFNRLKFLLSNKAFMDGITEKPRLNDIEMWRIINQGIAVHPIHIHLVQFQILDRIPFDTAAFNTTGQLRFTGEPQPPLPGEMGWKDTVQAMPGFVTRLIMRFGPYTGRYVYHCHILEHEDHDMMRPFEVVEPECCCNKCLKNKSCDA